MSSGRADTDAGAQHDQEDAGAQCEAPRQLCGERCVDVASSGTDCGRCGNDCLGGTCAAGRCEPVTLVPGAGPLAAPSFIATDGTFVCWTLELDEGTVDCARADGGQQLPTQVYAGYRPGPVVIRDGGVFWLAPQPDAGAMLTISGAPADVPDAAVPLYSFTLDGTYDSVDGYAITANAAGTQVHAACSTVRDGDYQVLVISADADPQSGNVLFNSLPASAPMSRRSGIAADDSAVYVSYEDANGGVVTSISTDFTGPISQIADGQAAPRALTIEGGQAYWAVGSPVGIRRTPLTSMAPTAALDVASTDAEVVGLVVAGDDVYWTERDRASIYVARAMGGPAEIYVPGQPGLEEPGLLARDARFLYWVDQRSGAVRRVVLR